MSTFIMKPEEKDGYQKDGYKSIISLRVADSNGEHIQLDDSHILTPVFDNVFAPFRRSLCAP